MTGSCRGCQSGGQTLFSEVKDVKIFTLVPLRLMTQFKGVIVVPSGVMRQHPSVESSRLTVTHRLTVLLNWANRNY